MKKHCLIGTVVLAMVSLMSSCKADIDLQTIDTHAKVNLGLAIPVGSMSATVGDFLGNGQVKGIYVGDNKVLFFRDTFDITRTYHDVDLKSKITNFNKQFDVYEKLNEMGLIDASGKVKSGETGRPISLDFKFIMQLQGINDNVFDERLDSALISNATFTSTVSRTNLPLPAQWVNSVDIKLGEEFHRPAGNTVNVCQKGAFNYDQNVPITIDQFIINLMKNNNPGSWRNFQDNAKKEVEMHIIFNFTIPAGEEITIPNNAAYNYSLKVEFINYEAIWGFFKPSSDMRDESIVVIEDEWSKWKDLRKAKLPFSDPEVTLHITHTITGAMIMHGEYLYAKSTASNDSIFSTYNKENTYRWRVEKFNNEGQYLPLNSRIGESISNTVVFDKDPFRGHIDNLFTIRPDVLGYKYFVDFDSILTPQIRVLPNTNIVVRADFCAPFKFNKGVEASYIDTLKNINLSKYTLDSLVDEIELIDTIKATNLKLVLVSENRIPLRTRGRVRFMDENNKVIMDPKDPTKPLLISQSDTLVFDAPTVVYEQGNSHIADPGRNVYILEVDKRHFDTLEKIKSIEYYVELDAEQMNAAYDRDPEYHVQITSEDKLKLKIGVSAHVDAVLNLNAKNK